MKLQIYKLEKFARSKLRYFLLHINEIIKYGKKKKLLFETAFGSKKGVTIYLLQPVLNTVLSYPTVFWHTLIAIRIDVVNQIGIPESLFL